MLSPSCGWVGTALTRSPVRRMRVRQCEDGSMRGGDSDARPLPWHFRIVGNSGSGKSSLARELAADLELPRLELDAVFWDADWTYRDLDEAHELIRTFIAQHPDGWVIDGNWTSRLAGFLDPGTPGGADVTVWLDHSRSVVMSRVIRRTLSRGIRREELWHGNRERPSSWLNMNPDRNIILWAWTNYSVVRDRMTARMEAGEPIVRLRGQREVDVWRTRLVSLRRRSVE